MLRMADRHEPCVRVKVKIQGVAMFVRMVCSSVWITMRNKGVVNMINLYCEVNGKIVGPSGIWTRIFGIPVRRSTNWAIEPNGEPSFNPFPPRDSPLTSKIVWRLTEWNNKGAVLSALGKERKGKDGWIAKDADRRGHVERHIEGAIGSRHTTTNHGSQLRSRCWFYRGRKTGEPGEKPSKHGRDQLQHSTHMWNLVVKSNTLTPFEFNPFPPTGSPSTSKNVWRKTE